MPPIPLTQTDLEDILHGSAILGSGGGGPVSIGKLIIEDLLKFPNPVLLMDPAEIQPDAQMAVSAFVGSPDVAADQAFPFDVATLAFRTLEQQGCPEAAALDYVLPGEVGAGNSFIPMTVAVRTGKPIVDADGAGRAIPALTMVTYAGCQLPIAPIVLQNAQTEVTLQVSGASQAEAAVRGIISQPEFGGDAGMALWRMSGATMQQVAIAHTLTYARDLGATLRQAIAHQADPVAAVCRFLDGWVLFRGILQDVQEQTAGGFDVGQVILEDKASGERVYIYNQNENLIAWSDQKAQPLAIAPDLISYLTTTGEVFSNADLQDQLHQEVAIIGARANPQLRDNPEIMAAFQQALVNLGYGGAYVPIEHLVAST